MYVSYPLDLRLAPVLAPISALEVCLLSRRQLSIFGNSSAFQLSRPILGAVAVSEPRILGESDGGKFTDRMIPVLIDFLG